MMKKKASMLLKQIVSMLSSVARAKSIALKSKTNELKARLMVFSLMKGKKVLELPGSISNKIHKFLLDHHHNDNDNGNNSSGDRNYKEDDEGDQSKAIVLYNIHNDDSTNSYRDYGYEDDVDNEKYPDLTHSLFAEEEEFDDPGGSIIDLVKNSKELAGEQDFSLEDEIDHVADLFINRFHRQMRLQKLESFKRYQEMMQRSV